MTVESRYVVFQGDAHIYAIPGLTDDEIARFEVWRAQHNKPPFFTVDHAVSMADAVCLALDGGWRPTRKAVHHDWLEDVGLVCYRDGRRVECSVLKPKAIQEPEGIRIGVIVMSDLSIVHEFRFDDRGENTRMPTSRPLRCDPC